MKKEIVKTDWIEGMHFVSDIDNYKIKLDAEADFGGKAKGNRPKPLMLAALGGCTAMDVVSLLNKMRMPFESLQVEVAAELTDEHPKVYQNVKVTYLIKGGNVDHEKVEKSVQLSQDKYCGVIAMFKAFTNVTYEIVYLSEALV